MANLVTLTLPLFFAVLISTGYGLTWCTPDVDYITNIQTLLESIAPQYDVYYSGKKKDTHPAVQSILHRLDADRVKYLSAKQAIETYTAEKLEHYELTPTVIGASEVDLLKGIFRTLDAQHNTYEKELEQSRKVYIEQEQVLGAMLQQIQKVRDANVVLEQSVNERNVTLSKTNETRTKLQKIINDRGVA